MTALLRRQRPWLVAAAAFPEHPSRRKRCLAASPQHAHHARTPRMNTACFLALLLGAVCLRTEADDKVEGSKETHADAKAHCKDVAFGCPDGYECRTPKEGCSGHCECYDPVGNVTLAQGCPVRVKTCKEGHFCVPEKAGECLSCNCDTPCAQATGMFSCQPKENQACTRRLVRGSCPVCQCETCPPQDCPRDCYVIQLDAGCKQVCICTAKDGVPFALLSASTVQY